MENDWIREFEDIREDVRILRAENEHLKRMLAESEKMVTALRYDRNFWKDELARKGGNN